MDIKIKWMERFNKRFEWSIEHNKVQGNKISIWEKVWVGDKIIEWFSFEEVSTVNV